MIEKINLPTKNRWESGYFRPKGKYEKRQIHKQIRRIKNLDTNRKGIYNRIGVYMEWS